MTLPQDTTPEQDERDDVVRILDQEGRIAPTPQAEPYLAAVEALDDATLEQFYRDMVLVRAFDNQATMLQRQGQLALWPPSRGQEAAQVGSVRASRPQDTLFPSYREHVVATVRGVDPIDVVRTMRGVSHGGWDATDPANGNVRNYTLVLGSQTLHATGYAMAKTFDGVTGTGNPETDEAVMVYYGDGASSQGDVHEAMVFAASYRTPQVFFLQNNQWAISVPVSRQSPVPLARRALGYGMEALRIDGNDVLASYAVTRRALDQARAGGGPRAIEAVTYRLGAHTTSDDPTKYRTRDEEESWGVRDPITRMRAYLAGRGASEAFFDGVDEEGAAYADDVRVRTLELEEPEPESMFRHVYSEPHPLMEAQAAWLADYEASFEGGEA